MPCRDYDGNKALRRIHGILMEIIMHQILVVSESTTRW